MKGAGARSVETGSFWQSRLGEETLLEHGIVMIRTIIDVELYAVEL